MCKRIFASQTNSDGEVPFFKIGTIGGVPDSYISSALFEDYKRRFNFPEVGEVLITCSGTVGRCLQYDGSPAYYQDSNIVWLHGAKSPIESEFLYWLLKRHDWKTLNTTTISRIYSSDLLNLKLSFPTAEEQEKITHFLILIDRRIGIQNKIIDDKKREIKVLNDLLYRQTIKKHFRFADISRCYAGLFGKSADDFGEGMPYITYLNVLNNRYIDPSQRGYVSVKDGESQNSLLYGDVVLTLSSETPQEVGVASVYLESGIAYLNSFCTILRFDDENVICSEYATWLFSTTAFRKHIYPFAQGSTRYNLNLGSFMQSQFAIPHIDSQKKIGHMLNGLAQMVRIEERELSRLYQMKKFLLNGLFI